MSRLRTAKALPPRAGCFCAALVRPGSALASRCGSDTPVWGIFEIDPALGLCELRFGDGSWLAIGPEDLADVIVLPELDDEALGELFDAR
ncbi:MAG: hypothetical protein Q4B94_01850 [Pseudomonadota bacterium]|nr:hypothetical protein [Pseudomonadota bacterium]